LKQHTEHIKTSVLELHIVYASIGKPIILVKLLARHAAFFMIIN